MTPAAEPVDEPVIGPLHARFAAAAAAGATGIAAGAAVQLLAALHLLVLPPEPGTDDRSEQVSVTVHGITVTIRRRADGLFVHVDPDAVDAGHGPLWLEVGNGGENEYAV
ncbi:hypothetical protein [Dactylosporangium sp. CS-033363]|uniref:hypothetical protein n=1 Tax=Dactylosporangium sp. CS-033363 TaxID=3239935 RepID=UPI003D91BCCA